MNAPERFVRMKEVAHRCGISYGHLRKLRCRHQFPLVFETRLGVLGVKESVLNEYLTRRTS